jgi:hypothetical protein
LSSKTIYEIYQAARSVDDKSNIVTGDVMDRFLLELKDGHPDSSSIQQKSLPRKVHKSIIRKFLNLTLGKIQMLSVDNSGEGILGRHYERALKLLVASELLNLLHLRNASLFIAQELVEHSSKYHFLNFTFQAYRRIYAIKATQRDVKGEIAAIDSFKRYLRYYELERLLEIEYFQLFRQYNQSNAYDQQNIDLAKNALDKYGQYENEVPSFYFHFFLYHIKYVMYLNQKRHDDVYRVSQKALAWFEKLEFNYIPGKLVFALVQIIYTIQKKEYDKAHELISSTEAYVPPKSPHWFKIKENELLLNFHEGNYQTAVSLFNKVITNRHFSSITNLDKDRWILYEAYINLILEAGNIEFTERKKRFSIQKFVNELPEFSKDKRAMNIPILIAQMLFLIVRRQYGKAIDRIEALDKYSSRYLRNNETFRSNCFIKMLLEIPKNSFNKLRIERAVEDYFRRLLDSEITLIDQPFEIEIIPYERLWVLIMNQLRDKHHYSPKTKRS